MSVSKVDCAVCGYLVNPVGHAERCGVQNKRTKDLSIRVRKFAWVGDARHVLDVREALISYNLPITELQPVASLFLSAEAQVPWYLHLQQYATVDSRGSSRDLLAQAFEANYTGTFRAQYIRRALAQSFTLPCEQVHVGYLLGMSFGPRDKKFLTVVRPFPAGRHGWAADVESAVSLFVHRVSVFEQNSASKYSVCVTEKVYKDFDTFYTENGSVARGEYLRKSLKLLNSSLDVAITLSSVNTDYIATSGPLALVK